MIIIPLLLAALVKAPPLLSEEATMFCKEPAPWNKLIDYIPEEYTWDGQNDYTTRWCAETASGYVASISAILERFAFMDTVGWFGASPDTYDTIRNETQWMKASRDDHDWSGWTFYGGPYDFPLYAIRQIDHVSRIYGRSDPRMSRQNENLNVIVNARDMFRAHFVADFAAPLDGRGSSRFAFKASHDTTLPTVEEWTEERDFIRLLGETDMRYVWPTGSRFPADGCLKAEALPPGNERVGEKLVNALNNLLPPCSPGSGAESATGVGDMFAGRLNFSGESLTNSFVGTSLTNGFGRYLSNSTRLDYWRQAMLNQMTALFDRDYFSGLCRVVVTNWYRHYVTTGSADSIYLNAKYKETRGSHPGSAGRAAIYSVFGSVQVRPADFHDPVKVSESFSVDEKIGFKLEPGSGSVTLWGKAVNDPVMGEQGPKDYGILDIYLDEQDLYNLSFEKTETFITNSFHCVIDANIGASGTRPICVASIYGTGIDPEHPRVIFCGGPTEDPKRVVCQLTCDYLTPSTDCDLAEVENALGVRTESSLSIGDALLKFPATLERLKSASIYQLLSVQRLEPDENPRPQPPSPPSHVQWTDYHMQNRTFFNPDGETVVPYANQFLAQGSRTAYNRARNQMHVYYEATPNGGRTALESGWPHSNQTDGADPASRTKEVLDFEFVGAQHEMHGVIEQAIPTSPDILVIKEDRSLRYSQDDGRTWKTFWYGDDPKVVKIGLWDPGLNFTTNFTFGKTLEMKAKSGFAADLIYKFKNLRQADD